MLLKLITVRQCFECAGNGLLLITYTDEKGEVAEWKTLQEIDINILPDEDFVSDTKDRVC